MGVPLFQSAFLRGQSDNVRLASEAMRIAVRAARVYECSRLRMLNRTLELVKEHRFRPAEAYSFGLLSPEKTRQDWSGFVSKRTMAHIQHQLNPIGWYYTTEDKALFYRQCQDSELPHPKVYGTTGQQAPGYSAQGKSLIDNKAWEALLSETPETGILLKPARSLFGIGIEVYSRKGETFLRSDRDPVPLETLAERLAQREKSSCLLVQERVTNHPGYAAVSDSRFLQSLRIVTLVDFAGEPQVLAAFQRVILADTPTDHFLLGRSGNIVLTLDTTSGAPVEVLSRSSPANTVSHHAWTSYAEANGKIDAAFAVPNWPEVIAIAKKAAKAFMPLRLVGWDIAVTHSGVTVLEGNFRSDPFPSGTLKRSLAPAFEAVAQLV